MVTANSIPFALASLLPGVLLATSALFGGLLPFVAMLSITVFVLIMDRTAWAHRATQGQSDWVPWSIGALHFVVLVLSVRAVQFDDGLTGWALAAHLLATGLFLGQISNSCAHELIHRANRPARLLGTAMYISMLNGQHVSAHMLVHHVHAGTDQDPNSAPRGQGFYRYLLQASIAEFRSGWQEETRRRRVHAEGAHPYVIYIGGATICLIIAGLLAGLTGAAVLLLLSLHAQIQLFLSDYLQHYGLRRAKNEHGKLEPMGPHHSWNAPQAYSAAMMLNAPLHSDHHMNPARLFPDLQLEADTMPTLPRSVPVMGALALVPPLWRRVMDPRVLKWSPDIGHGNVMPNTTQSPSSAASVLSD